MRERARLNKQYTEECHCYKLVIASLWHRKLERERVDERSFDKKKKGKRDVPRDELRDTDHCQPIGLALLYHRVDDIFDALTHIISFPSLFCILFYCVKIRKTWRDTWET